jgi:mono/diheme cytochrome c family protein
VFRGKWSVVSFSRLLKSFTIAVFVLFMIFACSDKKQPLKIADDRSYESSLFRQNCAICHGFEGEGKDIGGKMSANLRFSQKTEDEMYQQIANGGNGMLPFKYQLTEKDIKSLAKFIKVKLPNNQ